MLERFLAAEGGADASVRAYMWTAAEMVLGPNTPASVHAIGTTPSLRYTFAMRCLVLTRMLPYSVEKRGVVLAHMSNVEKRELLHQLMRQLPEEEVESPLSSLYDVRS